MARCPDIYVYVIEQRGTDVVKIGIANNMKIRLKALQNGNPHELHIHFTLCFAERATAAAVERKAHALLRAARRQGEWFACEGRDAKAAIFKAAAGTGYDPHLTALPPQTRESEATAP